MAAAQGRWLKAWADFASEAEDVQELDAERVLVLTRLVGRGKTSGIQLGAVQARGASVFTLRNGKVVRLVLYADRGRALADLGLAPKADAE
jgi:hypothetical protein